MTFPSTITWTWLEQFRVALAQLFQDPVGLIWAIGYVPVGESHLLLELSDALLKRLNFSQEHGGGRLELFGPYVCFHAFGCDPWVLAVLFHPYNQASAAEPGHHLPSAVEPLHHL